MTATKMPPGAPGSESELCLPGRLPVGHLPARSNLFESYFQWHVEHEILRRALDATNIGHHPHSLRELNDGDRVRRFRLESRRGTMIDHVGIKAAPARRLEPLHVFREAAGAEEARIEVGLIAAVFAALDP